MHSLLKVMVRLRRKKKLRPIDVAKKMGVSRQQVYNLETGRDGNPKVGTLERYAKAVGAKLCVVER